MPEGDDDPSDPSDGPVGVDGDEGPDGPEGVDGIDGKEGNDGVIGPNEGNEGGVTVPVGIDMLGSGMRGMSGVGIGPKAGTSGAMLRASGAYSTINMPTMMAMTTTPISSWPLLSMLLLSGAK